MLEWLIPAISTAVGAIGGAASAPKYRPLEMDTTDIDRLLARLEALAGSTALKGYTPQQIMAPAMSALGQQAGGAQRALARRTGVNPEAYQFASSRIQEQLGRQVGTMMPAAFQTAASTQQAGAAARGGLLGTALSGQQQKQQMLTDIQAANLAQRAQVSNYWGDLFGELLQGGMGGIGQYLGGQQGMAQQTALFDRLAQLTDEQWGRIMQLQGTNTSGPY